MIVWLQSCRIRMEPLINAVGCLLRGWQESITADSQKFVQSATEPIVQVNQTSAGPDTRGRVGSAKTSTIRCAKRIKIDLYSESGSRMVQG